VTQTIPSSPAAAAPSKGLAARIVGVLTSPRATYADVAARPRWLGVLAFVLIVGGAAIFGFLSTEVGKQAMLDQQVRAAESFGRPMNDAAYARMERMLPYSPYVGLAGHVVSTPILALIIAGVAFGVFTAALGGDATFKQVFAIVVHSGVVITLAQLFGLPLAYAKESMTSSTNLAVFLPFLEENTFLARLLGSVDLFHIWWIVSLAIGFGVLYRRRTGSIATTLFVVYGAIVLSIAALRTVLSGA
jgi:hypothetical protein